MLTLICGENSAASFTYLSDLKKKYSNVEYEIQEIPAKDVISVLKQEEGTLSLFEKKIIYFTQNLSRTISRSKNDILLVFLQELSKKKESTLVAWEEEKGAKEIRYSKFAQVKEFKVSKSIFNLLDSLYPAHRDTFLSLLKEIVRQEDEYFVFTMVSRHTRQLLLATYNALPRSLPPWMGGKIRKQASSWKKERLQAFYEGLHRVDISLKTSGSPYTLTQSLDILGCHFL